eukprot:gene10472-2994_t
MQVEGGFSMTEENDEQKFITDIIKLYTSEAYVDVFLIVGNEKKKFSCHKNILSARSMYFKELFSQEKYQNEENIYFPDKKSSIFETIINFFYSGKINLKKSNAFEVMKLAGYLKLVLLNLFQYSNFKDSVIDYSNEIVKSYVNEQTVFEILEESRIYKFKELHLFCQTFLEVHAKKLFGGLSFLDLSKDTILDILHSDRIQLPEIEIFYSVISWGKYQIVKKEIETNSELIYRIKQLEVSPSSSVTSPVNEIMTTKNRKTTLSSGSLIEIIEEEEKEDENKLQDLLNEKFKILYDYTENDEFVLKMKENLSDILEYIRFPILTPKELYHFVEPCKIVSDELLLEAYRSHALANRNDKTTNHRLKVREGSLFYVAGVFENIPISALKGWNNVYYKPYSDPTSEKDLEKCKGKRILVAARAKNSKKLALVAMGRTNKVLQLTHDNETTQENSVHWYYRKNHSFGFSDSDQINLGSADLLDGRYKLSWHLTGNGGYRLGDLKNLNSSEMFEKLIFTSDL